ncbi:hypothetical protein C3L33_09566, partial [Rhododendron williamsianum]
MSPASSSSRPHQAYVRALSRKGPGLARQPLYADRLEAVEMTNEVNQWAEKQTNGLIKEVLPFGSINDLTGLIFANALYFKGVWIEKFDVLEAKYEDFHLLNGSSVRVPFMTSDEEQFVRAFYGFKVSRLPYNPVNEEGTEAAAATSSGYLTFECDEGPKEIDFVADHPFLFVIREDMTDIPLPPLLSLSLSLCNPSYSSNKVSSKMDLKQLIRNQTEVSLSLAKQVSQSESKDSNLVFSPPLIHVVLGLIAAGSKGPTQSQVLSVLNSRSTDDLNSLTSQLVSLVFADGGPTGGPKLSFANGVWLDQSLSLKPSFKLVVDTVYKAALNHVDFQTKAVEVTNEVNQWAEKETNGLIKEVLPSDSVDDSTRLVFANALYFKGAWTEKFDASKTEDQEFHLLNGSSVQAPFMTSKKKQLVSAFDGFKVLRLPYKQGEDKRRFSMYFFLPDAKDGLSALMEKVSSESGFLDRHLPYQREIVGEFWIPKFKFSFGFEASKVMKGLGLVLPFSGGEGLIEMVDSPSVGLYISSIFHKACIEVNEEGTEAAAASACVMTWDCYVEPQVVDFVADHPFLFVIREDMTGVVLFIGQVLNPIVVD